MHDLSNHPYAKQACNAIAALLGERKVRGVFQDNAATAKFKALKLKFEQDYIDLLTRRGHAVKDQLVLECSIFIEGCLRMIYYDVGSFFTLSTRRMLAENLYENLMPKKSNDDP